MVEAQVQHLDGQFAARQHGRALAAHPALVARVAAVELAAGRRVVGHGRMHHGVVDGHHGAVDQHRVRDRHLAFEQAVQALGQIALAAAGRAVHEDGAAGIEGRPQLVEQGRAHHHAVIHVLHVGPAQRLVGHAVAPHLGHIVGIGHRRRTGVGVALGCLLGPRAAGVRQVEAQVGVGAAAAAARHFAQLLGPHRHQQRVEHADGQLGAGGQFAQLHLAMLGQDLAQQVDQEQLGQAGFFHRARGGGAQGVGDGIAGGGEGGGQHHASSVGVRTGTESRGTSLAAYRPGSPGRAPGSALRAAGGPASGHRPAG